MKPLRVAVDRRRSRQVLFWWILPVILIAGWWVPVLGYFIPVCMVAGVGVALFKGRTWCDWLCPRGSSFDLLLSRVSRKRKIPALFRDMKFRVLVMAVLMTVLATQIPKVWPSVDGMGRVFVIMLSITTMVGVILGVLTHHRNWCTFCPVGTLGNVLGRGKNALTITSKCNECAACDRVCPVQVNRWQYRPEQEGAAVVPEWDCVKCGLCVEACPQKALSLKDS
jgi:ferredoxin-type protein NapH